MKTEQKRLSSYPALGREELRHVNGGLPGAVAIIAWCSYLLEHEEQLFDGLRDGFNEMKNTITG